MTTIAPILNRAKSRRLKRKPVRLPPTPKKPKVILANRPAPSLKQRQKTAEILSGFIEGDASQVERFRIAIESALDVEDLYLVGACPHPDRVISSALTKAKLSTGDFTAVTMVLFSSNDKIRYYHDNRWHLL